MADREQLERYINPPRAVESIGTPYIMTRAEQPFEQIPLGQVLVGIFRSNNNEFDVATVITNNERLSEMIKAGHRLSGLYLAPIKNIEILQAAENAQNLNSSLIYSKNPSAPLSRKKGNHLLFDSRVSDQTSKSDMLRLDFSYVSVFDDYQPGRFYNLDAINLVWRAPDWFEYIRTDGAAFAFGRPNGNIIEPKRMFTDGGSIPRFFWAARNLSPWGYLPAFLIHDWQFDAHHSGASLEEFESVRDTMMEAVKTLMLLGVCPRSELDFNLLYLGINSALARDVWNSTPGVTLPKDP